MNKKVVSSLKSIGLRKKADINPYHGNLIVKAGVSKTRRKAIAASLAIHVLRAISQPE
jgi:hypothetical protein